MKFFSSLFISLVIGLSVAFGQTFPTQANFTTVNGVNRLVNGTVSVLGATFVDTSGTNRIVILYDNNSTTSTNIIYPSYTNYLQSVVSFTNVYTDSVGVAQTNIYNLLTNTPTFVASVTNEAPRIAVFPLPANGTFNFAPIRGIGVTRGVQYYGGASIGVITTQGLP